MEMIQGVVVSVGFDDMLALTLDQHRGNFDKVLVVTTPEDAATQNVAAAYSCDVHITSAFYTDGATFNKGAALWDAIAAAEPLRCWMVVFDSDIIMPTILDQWVSKYAKVGTLYVPHRIMVPVDKVDDLLSERVALSCFKVNGELEYAGYCQIFHTDDTHLSIPWYCLNWRHAGGYDSEFALRWPKTLRVRPPWQVIHIGDAGINWHGRTSVRLDGAMPTTPGCPLTSGAHRQKAQENMFSRREEYPGEYHKEKL